MISTYTEDHLVEQPAIQLMQDGRKGKILNFECWILNGRGGRTEVPCRRRFPDFTKSGNFTFC